ncbi:hypothetical protein [Actinomadura sp.]|uniref:hypothetical protein n=1 Tax=Actinomadura sp. TaxID=1989 RepID=UPI0037C9E946
MTDVMSAEDEGRGDGSRERRGDGGRRNSPPRRGGDARGGPGGSGDRSGGRKDRDFRGKRDDRKPGRPFKRSDDRRPKSGEGRSDDRRERGGGRFDGPRGGRGKPGERRFDGPRGGRGKPGERREERFGGARGPRQGQGAGPRRDGRPGGPQAGGGQGERRFEGRRQDRRFKDRDDRPGGRRFEGKREGRPGDRGGPFKGRGPKRPQDGGRPYGPPRDRRDARPRTEERERPRYDEPLLPDDITGEELDADARVELRTLPKDLAAKVARHLVMAGRLSEDEPEQSYRHAKAARRLASRVGIVREAAGIAAYHAGEWAEALAELRAARRLGAGDDTYLPVMVDCERGLGRPERALDLIKSPEAEKLDTAGRVELRIVESGVRRDMGQFDAAVVTLQIPELRDRRLRPWSMRLFYAYADALAEAGRADEAADWFARAAAADRDGETDAAERYAEIEGLHILDTEEEDAQAAGAAGDTDTGDTDTGDTDTGGADTGGAAEAAGDGDAVEEQAPPEPMAATDIAFQPAEPEVAEAPDEDVPQAPAVFLEPKQADEEQPPPGA